MSAHRLSRGVSLIEALVALAVMGFGLLGVVGLQATLRFNADVSKQRSEAVRMAQQEMERLRTFAQLSGAPAGERDYDGIASIAAATLTQPTGYDNTTFTRTVTVLAPSADEPRMKTVSVQVAWTTRRATDGNADESVAFTSVIAGISPELGAGLGLPGDRSATARPRGRQSSIPPAAVDQGNGTSVFAPPGAGTTTWTFTNATGQITSVCTAPGLCTAVTGWLLSGYVRFALNLDPTTTTPSVSENPPSGAFALGMLVTRSAPTAPAAPICYSGFVNSFTVGYYCLVPTAASPTTWSGTSKLTSTSGGDFPNLAGRATEDSASRHKVCRYSPSETETRPEAHPATYTNVDRSLTNQNFLVISAGNGSTAYSCPVDDTSTPLINGNTYLHQP